MTGERTYQPRQTERVADPVAAVQVAGPRHGQLTQLAAMLNAQRPAAATVPVQRQPNRTGLPDGLKGGVEALSGMSMDHVRVHYNSAEPAQLNAHAFARGSDIHVASGEERHVPHEAWHVVQQAQGRVRSTTQMKAGIPINDDAALEHEADVMGARALATPATLGERTEAPALPRTIQAKPVIQRAVWEFTDSKWLQIDGAPSTKPPEVVDVAEGTVYDDETDTVYQDAYDYAAALSNSVMSVEDLDEDDLGSNDYVMEVEEEDDDSDGSAADSDETMLPSTGPELDLEGRRAEGVRALQRPFDTSLLTKPSARFPTSTMTSTDKFKAGKVMGQRDKKSGPVTITLQTVGIWVNDEMETRERPILVSGIVEPTKTTGRGGAPDPHSGVQIYSGAGKQPKASVATERNSGIPDAERGHVMALELGGPDISQNIVPQWAKFQGSGAWRRMEVAVLAKAMKLPKDEKLQYTVEIFYKDSGILTPTLRTFGFPSGFKTTTRIVGGKNDGTETVEFNQGQAQDETDQMLAERQMSKADGPDWDRALDISKKKPGTRRPGARKPREPSKARKAAPKIDKFGRKKADQVISIKVKASDIQDGKLKPGVMKKVRRAALQKKRDKK